MKRANKDAFELLHTHIHLNAKGNAEARKIPGAFGHAQKTEGWFFGAARIDKPARWWEIHPLGDEILFLCSGEVAVTLEERGKHRTIKLREAEVCVVPRNSWHRVDAVKPGDLLFVTYQKGSRNRPI